jgi:hypothetical protein
MTQVEYVDDAWLDSARLLRTGRKDRRTSFLSVELRQLVIAILAASGALPKKQAEQQDPALLSVLEAYGLAQWERDKLGRLTAYQLTWKGQELADVLIRQARIENIRQTGPVPEGTGYTQENDTPGRFSIK